MFKIPFNIFWRIEKRSTAYKGYDTYRWTFGTPKDVIVVKGLTDTDGYWACFPTDSRRFLSPYRFIHLTEFKCAMVLECNISIHYYDDYEFMITWHQARGKDIALFGSHSEKIHCMMRYPELFLNAQDIAIDII